MKSSSSNELDEETYEDKNDNESIEKVKKEETLTIHAPVGSYAHRHALEKGFKFKPTK